MIAVIRKNMEKRDEGFTLIELLVVVIIIGILAAIAIPSFLSQRERGYQAEVTSSVRNYALEIEAAATAENGVYPATIPSAPAGLDAGGKITFAYAQVGSGTGFTLCGTTTKIEATKPNKINYSSVLGGLQKFGTC